MISPKAFSRLRSSIIVVAAMFVLAGLAVRSNAAELCRLPATNVFATSATSPIGTSRFSALSSRTVFSANFAAGSIQFTEAAYSISETGVTATILVFRSDDLSGPVTVDFTTSNGTAAAGQDYGTTAGTLFWADGDGDVKGFTIPITDDLLSEGNETVNITLSNPVGGAVIGSPGQTVLTILDDEEGFSLSINDVAQAEGNASNSLVFTVSLSGPAQQPVTVQYSTTDGTASSPSDYSSISGGLLTFDPGVTSLPVPVNINGDTTPEPDETFTVNLNAPQNATISNGSGTGTLLNDDAGATPTPTVTPSPTPSGTDSVQFSSTSYSVNESVGNATITVTRTGSGSGAASVNYATSNGSATSGQDYTTASGTLNWAAGDVGVKTFNVPITEDLNQESTETIDLTLSNVSGVTLGAPSTAVLSILDNDTIPEISINDVTRAEGDGLNQLSFTVTLSNASGQPVNLNYSTENGIATGGSDYVTISNSLLTFSPGETSKQIVVNILGDFVVEPDETFFLNITSATNAVIADSQGVATLLNDDAAGTIQFQSSSFSVGEADGTAAVTITRTGGLSQGVSVRFVTVDGSALAGDDYSSVRTTVVFEPDQATKVVNIPINNDNIDESDETVILALESPTGGAILGSPINAILTIIDNDGAPVLSVNNVSQSEGNSGTTAFTFTVSLTGQSANPVNVFYSTADGTATAPSDYASTQQGTLTFEPGESTKQVTVLVNGDFNNEANETFFVNLSGPVGATIGVGQGVGTISNDDVGGAFRFTSAEYSVGEASGFISITVQRTGGLSNGATVNYSTSNGTAIAGLDYTAVSGTLIFAGGQTSQSFVVPISNDGNTEQDESFNLILSNATGGGSTLGVPNTAIVYISDAAPEPPGSTLFDYDGDGRSDLSVRRPGDDTWYLLRGTAGYTAQQFGIAGDRIAPADYDGDSITDVAVFRPSTGTWFIFMSQTQTFQQFGWGADGDFPVPSDRDGDGKTDIVVFRPSNNTWYTRLASTGALSAFQFGAAGDKPVVGDFDGDGRGDIAVFRPSESNWYIIKSNLGFFIQTWGATGDIPVPADFDGDGSTDLAVFRPSSGQWFRSQTSGGFDSVNWGQKGDIPVAADYDGDGKSDVAVFRPSTATWFIVGSASGQLIQQFGQAADVPTQSAFIY